MSKLIKEDEDWLYLSRYIHDEPDSFSDWEMGNDGLTKYSMKIQEAEHYAFYELGINYRINKTTGEVEYLGIK